jgi:homoserine dehydrogenase
MNKPLRIGIAGLGTVGTGVVQALRQHGDLIAARAGRRIEIAAVAARDKKKKRDVDLSSYRWVDDAAALAKDKDIDAVVELIGGAEGPARALVENALDNGKTVVTANKALLAHHGYDLAQRAERNGTTLFYEASAAGGIPIIKALREGFAGNEIRAVYGILNGTCNYILTEMRETGRDFAAVLKDAQDKGYAEADPATDIDGIDAAHKLCILGTLAFGIRPEIGRVRTAGISAVTAADIAHATELGYRIKLLGIAQRHDDGSVVQSVEPCLVPVGTTIGAVEGVFNAVLVEGDFAGNNLSVGRGAGRGPTASAVVADLVDCAQGLKRPVFGIAAAQMKPAKWADPGAAAGHFYIHFIVKDRPGVLADIAAVMRDNDVSIESVLQRGRNPENPVSIVMTTHHAKRAAIDAACAQIGKLKAITGKPCLMRIETF